MLPRPRWLKAARTVLGWSQLELARRAKVSGNAVVRAELERYDPRRQTVEAIVKALQAGGIEFLPETETHGEGIRLRKPKREPMQTKESE